MKGQRALGFHQKYLYLCSEDEQRSYRFGTTWGRVNYENFHFWVKTNVYLYLYYSIPQLTWEGSHIFPQTLGRRLAQSMLNCLWQRQGTLSVELEIVLLVLFIWYINNSNVALYCTTKTITFREKPSTPPNKTMLYPKPKALDQCSQFWPLRSTLLQNLPLILIDSTTYYFLVIPKTLISLFTCVWLGLELNFSGK